MTIITAHLSGANRAINKLSKSGDSLRMGVQRAVKSSAIDLVGHIKQSKLSGGVLNVKTGALRRSITARFEEGADSFSALVGTNIKYARIHEYGFKGQAQVKAHQRMMRQAFGKPVKNPRKIDIRSHAMNMNVKARPFMAPSLDEKRPQIIGNIRAALSEALK